MRSRLRKFLDTLFGRTALVLLLTLTLGHSLPLLIFQMTHGMHQDWRGRDPFAYHAIAAVAAQRAAYTALPIAYRDAFLTNRATGPAALTIAAPANLQPYDAPDYPKLRESLSQRLGSSVTLWRDKQHTLWLQFDLAGRPAWLQMSGQPHSRDLNIAALACITAMIALLGLTAALVLLWPLYRPLQRLAAAHSALGRGERVETLPDQGPRELAQLTASFNHMVHDLNAMEAERQTIMAGVSHDLRTPISRLRVRLALLDNVNTDPYERDLDDIERITEQFLAFVRGQGEAASMTVVNLNELILDLVSRYEPGADISVQSSGIPPILADALSLRRAVSNLIENALAHAAAPIIIQLSCEDNDAVISVRDHGQGLSDAQLEQARRPFTRLDKARGGHGHCGLGLAIVERITKQHRGRLTLRNHPSGGLVAEIRLPLGLENAP